MTQQTTEDTTLAGGTPEGTASETGVRSDGGYTEENLRQFIREETLSILNPAFDTMKGRIDKIATLAPQLEEVTGSVRKTEALVRHVLKGVATPEEIDALDRADELAKEKQRADKLEAEKKAAQEAQVPVTDVVLEARWRDTQLDLEREAKRLGMTGFKVVDASGNRHTLFKDIPPFRRDDPEGMPRWKEAAFQALWDDAKKQEQANTEHPEGPTERGGGAATSDQELVNRYGAGADGGIAPGSAEAKRAVELMKSPRDGGKGLVPQPIRR